MKKILAIILPLLAGVGVAIFADKNLAGKVPGYDEPVAPGVTPKKIAWFVAVFAVGNIAFHFVARKLKFKI
jgi:hypothetical protein